jgi:hypothetical protein
MVRARISIMVILSSNKQIYTKFCSVVGSTPQMNQHPCKISTLASFTDILKQRDSENFSPVRNINCATLYRSISAQRDFRLARALSHRTRLVLFDRPTASDRRNVYRRGGSGISRTASSREEALRNKGPLIFHL